MGYPRIFPTFKWSIFNNVMSLDQSRASKNNRGIINTFYLVVLKWLLLFPGILSSPNPFVGKDSKVKGPFSTLMQRAPQPNFL